MSFLSKIMGKKAGLFPKVIQNSLPSGTLEMMRRFGKLPDVSQEALARKYWGWVYMCAQVSAQRFASTPLKLYASRSKGQSVVKNFAAHKVDKAQSAWLRKRIGKSLPQVAGAEDFEELEEHPLLDLLQNVNDQENSYEMKVLTSTMLDLTGDGYWYLERNKLGVPDKMFVLRSQWVRIVPNRDKFIEEYIYGCNQFGQDTLHIPAENVIHFKYPNPLDPWYGMGPVQSAAYAIESQELREKFILATMGNMARPDLIVKYLEGELDPKDRLSLEGEWNAMFRGAKNAGKVKVTDFRYEIDKVGWTPQELRFNEGEDWIMKKICGAFPVPVGLVDTSQISRAPRAGMEGSDLFMAQFNTLPRCTLFEEKLNEQLCPMYDEERLFVAFDNPVPKDKKEQLNEDSVKLNTCVVTVNEIRKRDGLEEVLWGDTPIPLQQAQQSQQAPLGSPQSPSADGAGAGNNQPNNNHTTGSQRGGGSPGGAEFGKKENKEILSEVIQTTATHFGIEVDRNGNMIKKAAGDGMTIEVDGAYVSPQLAGIPLRIRNERGRFDRRGVERLRASREAVESLKAAKDDEEGRWVTMRGQPVFIREGQSVEEAVTERYGQGGKPDRNSDEAADARAFKRENRKLDATISEIKDKIADNERKIQEAKTKMGEAELNVMRRSLDSIRAKKDILAAEAKVSNDRMEKLRQEWESKFPGKPLPKFARRKDESGTSSLEDRIQSEWQRREDILAKLKELSEELDNL